MALVVGKPLGIHHHRMAVHACGRAQDGQGLRVRDMIPAAVACGIGFTVSFLIASLAYKNAELSAEARFGVLVASLIAAAISGVLLSRQSKRFEKTAAAAAADAEDDESIDGDGIGQPSHTTEPTTPTEHPGTLADGTASVEIDFRH